MNWAVVSVGSNIDPVENVAEARRRISETRGWSALHLIRSSHFIRTSARGSLSDQPAFLNGAFLIETESGLDRLRALLKEIEDQMGRVRGQHKDGPRTIDLDVVIFAGTVVGGDFECYDFVRTCALELVQGDSEAGFTVLPA